MKNLLHNISTLAILILGVVYMQSCTDDWQNMDDVEVSFTATLPADVRTRSFGHAEQVNTLVVGVFDAQKKELYRSEFAINGTTIDARLSLAKNQTYSFVFWAYSNNQNIYNINDLTGIKMNALSSPITFAQAEAMDAFFTTKENITITGSNNYPIELVRPLAQVNVGTTGRPMKASFTAKSAPDTFHPFTNTVSGTSDFTWDFNETTTETFSVDDITYNYLTMGYLFAPTIGMRISADLTLINAGQTSKTVKFVMIEIEANSKSNIVGGFTLE